MNPLESIGSEELVLELERIGRKKTFAAGESVFSADSAAEFLPIVVSGKVKIFKFLTPGKEVIVNVFGPGDVFAIPPVLDGTNFPANAEAVEDSVLLLIYRPEMLKLVEDSREFSTFIMKRMSYLLRETTNSIKVLATAAPESKLASVLLWLAKKEDSEFPVTITLTRQDIAQIAGIATETTIRAIRKLADDDAVKIKRGKIVIEDPAILRRIADQ